jgi:hypothetical protein
VELDRAVGAVRLEVGRSVVELQCHVTFLYGFCRHSDSRATTPRRRLSDAEFMATYKSVE